MEKKLYVGNISFKAKEEDIRELFAVYGDIESVKIITDAHTGNPKGFGFVEMTTEESAGKAITELNGTTFLDRTITVAEAKPLQPREKRSFGTERSGFGRNIDRNRGQGKGRR